MHRNTASYYIPVLVRASLAGIAIFLFLFATEIVATYLLGGKLRHEKLFFYAAIYCATGIAFGMALGGIRFITEKAEGAFQAINHDSLTAAFVTSGFIWLYTFVVLNGYYLPHRPLFFPAGILLDLVLTVSCVPAFLIAYSFAKKEGEGERTVDAVSTSFTVAILITVLHSTLSGKFGGLGRGVFPVACVTLAYSITGLIAILVERKMLRPLLTGVYRFRNASMASVLVKAVVTTTCLAIVLYSGHKFRPLQRASTAHASPLPTGAPNIILIVLDTVRQDRLSPYGSSRDTSPNILRFAEESCVFDGYSSASWTWPSHATLMTGLYSHENGTTSSFFLDSRNKTLAELLGESGYSTAAFVANFGWLSPESGFSQGFDHYFAECAESPLPFPYLASLFLLKLYPDASALNIDPCFRAPLINRRAVEWLKKNGGRPFFMFLNYMDAHVPYHPPHPFDTMWNAEIDRPQPDFIRPDVVAYYRYEDEVNSGKRHMADDERTFLLDRYDGEIGYLDKHIGGLLSNLKELGLYENSLIVITSDHGEGFGEHGLVQHTGSLYQEIIRVPLIIKPPANGREIRSGGSASLVHPFHSILSYVQIPHTTGRQDVDLFSGKTAPILAEFHLDEKARRILSDRFGDSTYCLIADGLKLIWSSNGNEELFDIERDPTESTNVLALPSPQAAEPFEEIRSALNKKIEELNAKPLSSDWPDDETVFQIREKLKALGYLN